MQKSRKKILQTERCLANVGTVSISSASRLTPDLAVVGMVPVVELAARFTDTIDTVGACAAKVQEISNRLVMLVQTSPDDAATAKAVAPGGPLGTPDSQAARQSLRYEQVSERNCCPYRRLGTGSVLHRLAGQELSNNL